ncbi:peptide ligase PGM1-related protein [Streptomyces beijiangensis]|uniref:ATP-grasp domain-containing protein n=2 Tax=Streptomyces beijiangensis TaxID=163361 RepID=A0A939F8J6_9ACTN|nr:peptide ligase PGM1-related protein [Streptomyces beijiangensis]MBO0514360.1 ATP-grasp domain-containing protein [Streptomyces beijiangensis]
MVGDLAILSPDYRRYVGNQAQRMAWSLQSGDVLVLPVEPDESFLRYVTSQLKIERSSVEVLVPPPGIYGDGVLSRDRLADEGFRRRLRRVVAERDVRKVLPFHFDSNIVSLVKWLGLGDVTPGFGFLEQGGGRLLNSKSTFRALAGGAGVPVPEGKVCSSIEAAEVFMWTELLSRGFPGILKRDFHVAGFGNEIVSPVSDVEPIGALRTVVVDDRAELAKYLAERWDWLTDGGCRPVVIERYFVDSVPICAEFQVDDQGVEQTGHGEMRMAPVLNGHVWPAPSCDLPAFGLFLEAARRLCGPIHAMGYRGVVSVDAVVTPDGDFLINEFNCRVSGSTHAYHIAERVVGLGKSWDRVLVEQRRCTFPRVSVAVKALRQSGLAYDHDARCGVLIAVDDNSPSGGFGEYCVVAEHMDDAQAIEAEIADLFAAITESIATRTFDAGAGA